MLVVLFRGIPQDHSPGDRTDDKDDDSSRPESVDSESFLDVVEAEDLFDQTAQDVSINEEDSTKQTQENDSLANANITGEWLVASHKCTGAIVYTILIVQSLNQVILKLNLFHNCHNSVA